ncbi:MULTISPECIES: c-type cytochrome [Winogradskyella]|uniref:c-type cytochrome n=1 Tax=Winogradskyella TaxID=286104 RepID=UPI000C981089|nr:cytochrome c [Winogradskyella sp. MH6]MAB48895.1 cytochrome C [Flavobacteriaceae bacterium]|tara:strand:- start:482 stop:937 length:456 start_codon:yes stop_codon:yes gene_type:complete
MIKTYKLLFLLVFLVSCNSNNKKNSQADYSINKETTALEPQLKDSYNRGKLVYDNMCITCHMSNGEGAPKVFPPLAQSDYLKDNQESSIKGVKNGISGKIIVNGISYNSVMTPLGLSDEEVADVINYINNSWGNKFGKFVTAEDVTKVIKN